MSEGNRVLLEEGQIEDCESTVVREENPTEILYFLGLVLYITRMMDAETQWEYPTILLPLMDLLVIALLGGHVFLSLRYYESKQILLLAIALLVSAVSGYNSDNFVPWVVTCLLVFGAVGIDFKKILKVYLLVGGTICVITVIASLMGIIENVSDTLETERESLVAEATERQCLGYGWSTNMANHVFFLILTYFAWIGRKFNFKEMLLFFTLSLWVLGRTVSRLSMLCVVMLLVFSLAYRFGFFRRIMNRKITVYMLILSVPFFAFISYYMTASFDEASLEWIVVDVFLTGRLSIGKEALESAGMSLFGQEYDMYSSARDDGQLYNYLDNSYLQLFVIYGLLYASLLIAAYVVIVKQAGRRKDVILMVSVFMAGFTGLIAQHFIEAYMNPFLLALFASHLGDTAESVTVVTEEDSELVTEIAGNENAETYGIA